MPLALRPFALERYFAKYEFSPAIKHLLCCSDAEPLLMAELIAMADEECARWWGNLTLGYTETNGLRALRTEIASKMFSTLCHDDIVVAAPQEAIFLAMHSILEPGDTVICQSPCYQSLYEVSRSIGAHVLYWEATCAEDGREIKYDVSNLRRAVDGNPVKLVICNVPHNPTGWLPTKAEFEQIRACCLSSTYPGGAFLFCDEIYRGLETAEEKLPAAADLYPGRGISLGGLSKAFGLPGLRIGWLACKDESFLQQVLSLKDYTTICSSAPSELLALMALRAMDKIIAQQISIISRNLELMDNFCLQWGKLISWYRPRAGTVAYPRINLPVGTSIDDFCRALAEQHGILLLPGSLYKDLEGSQDLENENCARIRVGYGRSTFEEGLCALNVALEREFPEFLSLNSGIPTVRPPQ